MTSLFFSNGGMAAGLPYNAVSQTRAKAKVTFCYQDANYPCLYSVPADMQPGGGLLSAGY